MPCLTHAVKVQGPKGPVSPQPALVSASTKQEQILTHTHGEGAVTAYVDSHSKLGQHLDRHRERNCSLGYEQIWFRATGIMA